MWYWSGTDQFKKKLYKGARRERTSYIQYDEERLTGCVTTYVGTAF